MLSPFCKTLEPQSAAVPDFSAVLDEWLCHTRLRVKRSTYSTYAGVAERYIRPELGEVPLEQLTSRELAKFLTGAENRLSPSTVRLLCHVLRSCLALARSFGAPLPAGVEIASPRAPKSEARVLDEAARLRLERELTSDVNPVRLGLLICLHTGLRLGEICALRWGDFSPDSATVRIRRTVQRVSLPDGEGPKTALVFDSPKSASSNRLIPLPARLLPLIRRMRAGDGCYVLTGREDEFWEPRRLQRLFQTELKAAGLPEINFHALRHTFATNCVGLGCDATTLSRILGHSDVSTTLNIYVHPSFESMRRLMDRL